MTRFSSSFQSAPLEEFRAENSIDSVANQLVPVKAQKKRLYNPVTRLATINTRRNYLRFSKQNIYSREVNNKLVQTPQTGHLIEDIYEQVLSTADRENGSESIKSTIYQRKIWYKLNQQRKYLAVKQIFGIFIVKLAVLLSDIYLVQQMNDVFWRQMSDILELRKGIQFVVQNSASSFICSTSLLDEIMIQKEIIPNRTYNFGDFWLNTSALELVR